jgi:tetratricopeptide (TPR) repeat protein
VPLVGVFVVLTWGAADLLKRTGQAFVAPLLAGTVLLVCGVHTRLHLGVWKDSYSLWAQTVSVTTDNARAHNNYGAALLEKKQYAKAQEQFEAYLRLRPNDPVGLESLGHAVLHQNQKDEAMKIYAAAVRLDPKRPYANFNLGLLEFERGRVDQSAEYFEASLSGEVQDPWAWYNLGRVRLVQKKYEPAKEAFENAARLASDKAEFHLGRGEALLKLDRPKEALVALLEAERLSPGVLQLQPLLADAFAGVGQFQEAVAVIDRALPHVDPVLHGAFVRSLQDRRRAFEKGQHYRPD